MMYILCSNGLPVHVTPESPYTGTPQMKVFPGVEYDEVKNADRLDSFAEAESMAKYVTALTGEDYLPHDNGEWTSHRFGICKPPKVGQLVSYGFNGDYYPCGTIVKITKGLRVTTSTGDVFNRKKKTDRWVMVGGTWSLVEGVHNDKNPEF